MTTSLYLRPVGLCWGEDARQAVVAGCAGRLAGLDIAFTEIELIERDADRDWRSLRPYADLAASSDARVDSSLRPRCSCSAANSDGPLGSTGGSGGAPGGGAPCGMRSGVQISRKSNVPASCVRSRTTRWTKFDSTVANCDIGVPPITIRPGEIRMPHVG